MDPTRLGEWVTIHRRLGAHSADHMEQTLCLRGVNFHVKWDLAVSEAPQARRVARTGPGALQGRDRVPPDGQRQRRHALRLPQRVQSAVRAAGRGREPRARRRAAGEGGQRHPAPAQGTAGSRRSRRVVTRGSPARRRGRPGSGRRLDRSAPCSPAHMTVAVRSVPRSRRIASTAARTVAATASGPPLTPITRPRGNRVAARTSRRSSGTFGVATITVAWGQCANSSIRPGRRRAAPRRRTPRPRAIPR